ncbi:MAG: ABC transporter [Peptococcaceae bacterium BRH_c4b]|nr:MAG: ABC transporter [Peptococcaceae bacterium BRH_c4b]
MIFIYNCYGGTHSSSMASAVHLKKLPQDRIPTWKEILNTDHFNRLTYKDLGRIIYRGTDEEGNKVFSLGRGTSKVLIPCLKNLITILYNEYGFNEKIIFSNMTPTVTFPMTIGGFLSRGLGIDFLGVPLLVIGAQQSYRKVVEVVKYTKECAKTLNDPVLVL